MKVYRTEFPNPQFERENWLCLNGEWEFEIDNAKVGKEKGYQNRPSLDGKSTCLSRPKANSAESATPTLCLSYGTERKLLFPRA